MIRVRHKHVSRWEPASPGDGQWKALKRKRKAARKAARKTSRNSRAVIAKGGQRAARKCLSSFWRKAAELSQHKKLAMLKELANLNLGSRTVADLAEKRRQFNDKKWLVDLRGAKCLVCGEPGQHRHHVISLANGGHNGQDNIVVLCEWCHQDIHPFMAKKSEIDLERELERAAGAMGLGVDND